MTGCYLQALKLMLKQWKFVIESLFAFPVQYFQIILVFFFQNSQPVELNSSSARMITSTSVVLDEAREEIRQQRRVSNTDCELLSKMRVPLVFIS